MKISYKMSTLILLIANLGFAAGDPYGDYQKYVAAVKNAASMYNDQQMSEMAKRQGLDILPVTWEDTGRTQGSVWGPNISDMTIQVHTIDQKGDITPVAMPVIRYPNFSDKTADISADQIFLKVGNEKNTELKTVNLAEYIDNLREYLSKSDSWKGSKKSLLHPRDTHFLVSAQAALLPVPEGQKAHFNPVLFNYPSYPGNPAVLTIVATREGTSATVIDNNDEESFTGWGAGQRLFFNENGKRSSFTGERLAEFAGSSGAPSPYSVTVGNESGLNMVLLIQVPLVHKERSWGWGGPGCVGFDCPVYLMSSERSVVDDAVIGHGPIEGDFNEIRGYEIERDGRLPIRVTVQFYKAVGVDTKLDDKDFMEFRKQIDRVYAEGDYVGSLVVGGKNGRPTEHDIKCEYWNYPWWPDFWPYQGKNISLENDQAVARLQQTYGNWWYRWTCDSPEKLRLALDYLDAQEAKK